MKVIAIIITCIAFISLVFAYGLSSWVSRTGEGTDRIKVLSSSIKEAIMAFLKREYKIVILVMLLIFILLGITADWITAALYVAGTLFSLLAGFFGTKAAAGGSARTVSAAVNEGVNPALKTAFRSAAVMGLCAAGLGLLGMGGALIILKVKSASVITGFGFGAATAALFGRVGGGIFHKAADAASGLIEKAESGILKEDPRNPAAIAAQAGELVGNAAGMASEMFLSYTGAMIAAISVAAATKDIRPNFGYPFDLPALQGAVFPLAVAAAGILAAIAGIMFVRGNLKSNPTSAVNAGKYLGNGITAVLSVILSYAFFGNFNCAVTVLTGMLIGALNGKITNTYTSGNSKHLKKIAGKSPAGYLMINEYGVGMMSTLWPIVIIATGVLISNGFADYYGITLAAVGILSTTGMITAIDAFVPVAVNTGKIARMAELSEEAGPVTDMLDITGAGNAATGKGFATGAAALTALALIFSYASIAELKTISILKPSVISALFLGAMLAALFSALTMSSAMKAAAAMIGNARQQFLSDNGIIAGGARPDYAKCADSGAKAAFKGVVVPGLLAVAVPFAVGLFMGTEALGGLLAGILISGVLGSVIMANTGGSWNHAEKYSPGDPFKDAAAFSINCFILIVAMTAVIVAPMLVTIRGML